MAEAVYTNTGVMGLVRAPTRSILTLAATPNSSALAAAGRSSWLLDSIERAEIGSLSGRGGGKPGWDSDRLAEPLALEALTLYVPGLVLRQFDEASVRQLPYAERVRGALLFADITGFTQLTQQLQASELGPARGAEELNKILSDYFDLLIKCFHAHGGDVVSFSGDAMTVLFEAVPVEGGLGERSDGVSTAAHNCKGGGTTGGGDSKASPPCGHMRQASNGSLASGSGARSLPLTIAEEASLRESTMASHEPSGTTASREPSGQLTSREPSEGSLRPADRSSALQAASPTTKPVGPSATGGMVAGVVSAITRTTSASRLMRSGSSGEPAASSRRSDIDDVKRLPPALLPGLLSSSTHATANGSHSPSDSPGPIAGLISFFSKGSTKRTTGAAGNVASTSGASSPIASSLSKSTRGWTSSRNGGKPTSPRRSPTATPRFAPSSSSSMGEASTGAGGMPLSWTPNAVASLDPGRAALVRASLRAAQCALDMFECASHFSLERYSHYGVAAISLHAAMGAGELIAIHVAGNPPSTTTSSAASPPPSSVPDGSPAALAAAEVTWAHLSSGCGVSTPTSSRGDRPRSHNPERRDGFALMGTPMSQLRAAEKRAKERECVLSPEVWGLLAPHAEASVDEEGFAKLRGLRKAAHSRAWREADAERAASLNQRRDVALSFVERSPEAALRLAAYVPEPVQYRLRTAGMNWLADFRLASILFVRVLSLNHEGEHEVFDAVVAKTQQVFGAIRAEIARFEGMLARFNVDDKGTILFAAFGPPPYQHEDDAVRGVLCALEIVRSLRELGHEARVGLTTGTVFAGSVGNAERGEYTFYGDTVNMAARLMTSDVNDSVLVDEHTMRDAAHEVNPTASGGACHLVGPTTNIPPDSASRACALANVPSFALSPSRCASTSCPPCVSRDMGSQFQSFALRSGEGSWVVPRRAEALPRRRARTSALGCS